MISWIIIVILVVLALFILKASHFRHRFWVVILVLLILFLYVSISVVYGKYDLNFSSTGGVFNAVKVYFGWLGNGFHNLKTLTGNAVKMDWTSANASFFNKTEKIPPKKI